MEKWLHSGRIGRWGLGLPLTHLVPPWHLLGAQLKMLQAFVSSFLFQWRSFSEGEMKAWKSEVTWLRSLVCLVPATVQSAGLESWVLIQWSFKLPFSLQKHKPFWGHGEESSLLPKKDYCKNLMFQFFLCQKKKVKIYCLSLNGGSSSHVTWAWTIFSCAHMTGLG